jgi:6,7-dimethyl-8-ribityllumazine synthase
MSEWSEGRKIFDVDSVEDEDEPKGWAEPAEPESAEPYAAEEILEEEEEADDSPDLVEPVAEEEEDEEPEAVEVDEPELPPLEHVASGLRIPDGYRVVEGEAHGEHRAVAVVVGRFNGKITSELLTQALDELELHGVSRTAITIMPVPGAFELPLAAMALAKTRRYACIVALGCVIRGETPHFEHVSNEAASGLQLAALETGTPVAFGVLTCENEEQAWARVDRGADAARSALEMAEVFSQLRAAAGS